MGELEEIGFRHGTDKSKICHDYLNTYERLFEPWRYQQINLLELGVQEGRSIRMWREYFPSAMIFGLDNQSAPIEVMSLPNVAIFRADQADPALAQHLGVLGGFDIVIDDCSHISANTVASFKLLWPLVRPGGFYIIEDMAAHNDNAALEFVKSLADWKPRGLVTVPQMLEHYAANPPEYAWIRLSSRLAIIEKAP